MTTPESLPEADLVATRAAIEAWLEAWLAAGAASGGLGRDLAANNLTLWARSFLGLTEAASREAEAHLLRRGAEAFVERVLVRAALTAQGRPAAEAEAMTRAFLTEVASLNAAGGERD